MNLAEIGACLNQHVGWIVALGLPAVGMALKSYLDVKARNLANRQDFNKLLEQQQKTELELGSIRSEITHNVWLKQRRWELRREAYANVLAELHERQAARSSRVGLWQGLGIGTETGDVATPWLKMLLDEIEKMAAHSKPIMMGYVTIRPEAKQVLTEYLTSLGQDFAELSQPPVTREKLLEIAQRIADNTTKTYDAMLDAAAKEFEGDE